MALFISMSGALEVCINCELPLSDNYLLRSVFNGLLVVSE